MKFRLIGTCAAALKGAINELAVATGGQVLALTERREKFLPEVHPFLNPTFGIAMNQNIAFSGTPEIIHNGGTTTEWDGTALQGSWDFSTGDVVTLANGVNLDQASFAEESPTTIDMSGFTALTGVINLTTYSGTLNTLIVTFDLAGVTIGNSINLNDYIDPGDIGNAQNFVVPKADLGLSVQLIDGMTILLTRSGGPQVGFTLDDIQLEAAGVPAVFKTSANPREPYHITELRMAFADTFAGTVTNGTMPGLAHDQFLGLAELANGINFQRVQDGKTIFSINLKTVGDFLATGSELINAISDGVDTFFVLAATFPEPIVLQGPADLNF
ncbi:MAG: hypothetical protein V3S68_03340, partial [Dehalococcoidia bacterium]